MSKNRIIILEGQDRCSKTTLTSQLSKLLGPGVICHHAGSPPKLDSIKEMQEWEESNYALLFDQFLILSDNTSVITDRFHLGAAVYGRKFRNYPKDYTCADLEQYFEYYEDDQVYLIVITDYADKIKSREDGMSLETSVEEYEETRKSFISEYECSTIPNKLMLNITDIGGFDQLLPTIINFLEV